MLELATLIPKHAQFRRDATAVVVGDERLTYAQFGARVAQSANLLRAIGVGKGDKVVTVLHNSREALELVWSVPAVGAALVPLSPLLMPDALTDLLRDSEAKCVISQRSMTPILDQSLVDDLDELRRRGRVLLVDGQVGDYVAYGSLSAAEPTKFMPEVCRPEDLFNIMYTSGTTGVPKGIMLSHYVRSMYCLLMASAFRITPESRTLHAGGIMFNGAYCTMMPTFFVGASYTLLSRFDADVTIDTVQRERITHIALVPTQIMAILDSHKYHPERLASLECILSLGAPLLREYKDRISADLPNRFYELYGLTEGFVTILDREDAARKLGSVGRPTQYFDMRILDAQDHDVAVGEIGEIVGRGPLQMQGYYNRPDLTAATLRDGWIYTGDLGHVDTEGYLYLAGRKKDMIDSGGIKVYAKDIEELAARHPSVREVAVFGVPHEKWGETPMAAVTLVEGSTTSSDELHKWINDHVDARYQRVSNVIVMDEFPRNAAGKIRKGDMRDPYWT